MQNPQSNEPVPERVPFLGVKRRWVGYALFIFVISLLVYASFSTADSLTTDGWRGFQNRPCGFSRYIAGPADFGHPTGCYFSHMGVHHDSL